MIRRPGRTGCLKTGRGALGTTRQQMSGRKIPRRVGLTPEVPAREVATYLPEAARHRADLRDIQDNDEDEEIPGALRHLVYDQGWS